MTIRIKTGGDAHRLLQDFIKYACLDPETMARVMQYDLMGFRLRLKDLQNQVEGGDHANA